MIIKFINRIKPLIVNNNIIIKNISWLFFDKIFRMGTGIIVSIWITRYLGPTQYGLLSYCQTFVAFFASISKLGLDGIVIRRIIEKEDKNLILGTSFILKFAAGIFFCIISISMSAFLNESDTEATFLISIIAIGNIMQSFDVIDLWFQSKIQSKYTVIVRNASFTIISFFKIIFILWKMPIMYFAILGIGETFLSLIGLLVVYKYKKQAIFDWRFKLLYIKILLKDAWPLILSGIVVEIYMKIDQIMLKQLIGNYAVGIYTVGVKFSEIWYFIPVIISSSILPKFLNKKRESKKLYEDFLQKMFNFFALGSYILCIFVSFTSVFLITSLFGKEFYDAGLILIIHIWSILFVSFGVIRSQYYLNENLNLLSFYSTFFGMILNVILNFILIPKYSYFGASYATLISYMGAGYISTFFFKKTRKVFYMQTRAAFLLDILKNK